MRYLVTGTGRCGTTYMAKYLEVAYDLEVSHERVFTPQGIDYSVMAGVDAESSWMAAPHLAKVKHELPELKVIWLVRHPRDVVLSLLGIGFFSTPGPYLEFARKFADELRLSAPSAVDAAINFIQGWGEMIAQHADMVVRVEDIPGSGLDALVGAEGSHDEAAAQAGQFTNARPRATVDLSPWQGRLGSLCELQGYELPGASR